jgi:hypothetical protein
VVKNLVAHGPRQRDPLYWVSVCVVHLPPPLATKSPPRLCPATGRIYEQRGLRKLEPFRVKQVPRDCDILARGAGAAKRVPQHEQAARGHGRLHLRAGVGGRSTVSQFSCQTGGKKHNDGGRHRKSKTGRPSGQSADQNATASSALSQRSSAASGSTTAATSSSPSRPWRRRGPRT